MSCFVCHQETHLLSCANCGQIKYCSAVCQRQDWPHHRPACRAYSERPLIENLINHAKRCNEEESFKKRLNKMVLSMQEMNVENLHIFLNEDVCEKKLEWVLSRLRGSNVEVSVFKKRFE